MLSYILKRIALMKAAGEAATIGLGWNGCPAAVDSNDFSVSFIGFLGPVTLFCIMYFLTIPLTEKTMASSRPYWEELTRNSNKFLPFL